MLAIAVLLPLAHVIEYLALTFTSGLHLFLQWNVCSIGIAQFRKEGVGQSRGSRLSGHVCFLFQWTMCTTINEFATQRATLGCIVHRCRMHTLIVNPSRTSRAAPRAAAPAHVDWSAIPNFLPYVIFTAVTIVATQQKLRLLTQLQSFSVSKLKCFDESDRPVVTKQIAEWCVTAQCRHAGPWQHVVALQLGDGILVLLEARRWSARWLVVGMATLRAPRGRVVVLAVLHVS